VRTERGLDRLVTFLDAVVAIAITLLVLPLAEVLDGTRHENLSTVLRDNAGSIGAFALSFAVISRLWLAHHRLVEHVGGYDRPFVLLNMLWILTIVVAPFATQVAAAYDADRLAMAIYIGTLLLSSACLSGLSLLVQRRPALRRGETKHSAGPALVTTAAILAALVLAELVPRINYWSLLLLLLTAPVEVALRRRGAQEDVPPEDAEEGVPPEEAEEGVPPEEAG
jgi:uncharacterized membrane protein